MWYGPNKMLGETVMLGLKALDNETVQNTLIAAGCVAVMFMGKAAVVTFGGTLLASELYERYVKK